MKFLGLEISKKLLIGIIVGVVVVGGGITTGVILMNKDNQKQEEKQKDTILLIDNLEFEINSEVNLLSLVSEDNKVKVLSEDETIDTSTLGEKEITIKYEVEEQEEEKTFKITIIDTQAPTIEYEKELTTTAGTKIDLLKNVKVTDNSNEEIEATIESDYSFDSEGTYNLKYVAIDSSNNKSEEEFTLIVNKKPTCNLASGTITQTKPSSLCEYTTKTLTWDYMPLAYEEKYVWALRSEWGNYNYGEEPNGYGSYRPTSVPKDNENFTDWTTTTTIYIIK